MIDEYTQALESLLEDDQKYAERLEKLLEEALDVLPAKGDLRRRIIQSLYRKVPQNGK